MPDTSQAATPAAAASAEAGPQLVVVNNAWLSNLAQRIRSRPIPWEGYQRADLVSSQELQMIRSIDATLNHADDAPGTTAGSSSSAATTSPSAATAAAAAAADQRTAKMDRIIDSEQKGREYARLFVALLAKLSRTDTLQQILVFVGDMLEAREHRAVLFLDAKDGSAPQQQGGEEAAKAWPWAPLLKLLDMNDDFAPLKAAQLLTLLLVTSAKAQSSTLRRTSPSAPPQVVSKLLAFLSALINAGSPKGRPEVAVNGAGAIAPPSASGAFAEGNGADIAIQLLEALLRVPEYRQAIWSESMEAQDQVAATKAKPAHETSASSVGLIQGLTSILRASVVPPANARSAAGSSTTANGSSAASGRTAQAGAGGAAASAANGDSSGAAGGGSSGGALGPQMQYQVIFCFWLLSFDAQIAEDINAHFGIIPALADVARAAVKEKVVRIVASTLRNLVAVPNAAGSQANAAAMLGAKLLPLTESLLGRKWSDEEIEEDLTEVKTSLGERLKGMSTYDEYLSELQSGHLTWENPAHSLEDFWRANAQRMLSENGGEGVELLVKLLATSEERSAETLAVACHDAGKLVQHTDGAKKRLDELGAKTRIMSLIAHPDADVKFRALGTVSKLVSESWRS